MSVAHFKLFVDEWRRVVRLQANFTLEGRRCLMLEWLNTRKEALILYQSKVSTALGKQSPNFVWKATQIPNCCPSEWTRGFGVRFEALWGSSHLETKQQSGILNSVFRLQYSIQERPVWMVMRSKLMLCNSLLKFRKFGVVMRLKETLKSRFEV